MEKKKLGLWSAMAASVGLIVASNCLVSLSVGMAQAGNGFIISMIIVTILNIFAAMSFSELNILMPDADGGTSQYISAAFGKAPSIVCNISTYVIALIFASTAELAICGTVLSQLFFPGVDPRVVSMVILVAFFLVNLKGIDIFANVQNFMVYFLLISMGLFGIIGLTNVAGAAPIYSNVTPVQPGASGVAATLALAFWLFIGGESVIPLSKDMKNPKRDIFLAFSLGLIVICVVQSLMGSAMVRYVAQDEMLNSNSPQMTFAINLLGDFGKYWMGLACLMAAGSTLSAQYMSSSKILHGMAQDGIVPKCFLKENRYNTPYIGLLPIAISDAVLIISNLANTEGITFICQAACCFWLVTYIMMHAAVLVLRKKYPDAERNKKMMFMGIPQIIGIVVDIYMILYVDTGITRIKILSIFGVLLVALVIYSVIWVRTKMNAKLFEPTPLDQIR